MSNNTYYFKGTFAGLNHSLGYLTNQEYLFKIIEDENRNAITIYPYQNPLLPPTHPCPYQSYHAFFNNWKHVTQITDRKFIVNLWGDVITDEAYFTNLDKVN